MGEYGVGVHLLAQAHRHRVYMKKPQAARHSAESRGVCVQPQGRRNECEQSMDGCARCSRTYSSAGARSRLEHVCVLVQEGVAA